MLAGPGSGKTKTLSVKLARMLVEDVHAPRRIACITYSGQCVLELKRRLSQLGVEDGGRVAISTLHAFCLQHIVIPYAALADADIPAPLSVASDAEQKGHWESAIEAVVGVDQRASNWRGRCEAYRRTHLDRNDAAWRGDDLTLANIVEDFEARLRTAGLIDFDGMVLVGLKLVEQHDWVRRALAARFPILVVDEYQDLGHALHRLVLALWRDAGVRLLAVGDPDQSIFGFTGATPALLRDLAALPSVERVQLKLNYRSGAAIVRASEAALGEVRGFEAAGDHVGTIEFHEVASGVDAQIDHVCNSIVPGALTRRPGRTLGDIAILYRDRDQGELIAAAAESRSWSFVRTDRGSPYRNTPLILWLRECALWCVEGWRTATPSLGSILSTWRSFNRSLTSTSERREVAKLLVEFLISHRDAATPLADWIEDVSNSVLTACVGRDPMMRDEAIALQELRDACAPSGRLRGLTLGSFAGRAGANSPLNLLTLHSSKGLEFDVVVMFSLEDGRLPDFRAQTTIALAEERRLFYVGLTRARHEVHLVYSGWYANQYGRQFRRGRSRFIDEVDRATRGE